MSWTRRVRRNLGPRELDQLRDAAEDIAEQGRLAPTRARVVFQTVADCAFIGTAVIGGAMAVIHLWKALFPKPRVSRQEPQPEAGGAGGEPPRRRGSHVEAAADGYERGRSRGG